MHKYSAESRLVALMLVQKRGVALYWGVTLLETKVQFIETGWEVSHDISSYYFCFCAVMITAFTFFLLYLFIGLM